MNFQIRLHKVRAYMRKENISAIIIVKPVNQYYISGFETVTYSRPIWTVIDQARCSLILPGIEEARGREISIADAYYPYFETPSESHLGISPLPHLEKVLEQIGQGGAVGVETEAISLSLGDRLRELKYELKDVSGFLSGMRAVKDADELSAIRKAADLASFAVSITIAASREGVTELEIEAIGTGLLQEKAKMLYPDSTASPGLSMCISGITRTILPHTMTCGRILQKGDIVINTRLVSVDGYYADCQRTFFVGGTRTKEERWAYDTIVQAQERAIEMIKPGLPIKELDLAARKIIDGAGYGPFFTNRLGKSSGLELLEEPFLRFDSEGSLEPGMTLNILPSVYIPGVGGFRISDTILVTETGCEILTEGCSKNLDDLSS